MPREQITNEKLTEMISDAIYTYNVDGRTDKELMEELYKYLPKDKVDEYVFEYGCEEEEEKEEEIKDPRSGIFAFTELEFVEHFRLDNEVNIER